MHICLIFSHTGLNGVTTSGLILAQGLLDRGHDITLVHRPGAWLAQQPLKGNVQKIAFDMGVRLLNYHGLISLHSDLKNRGVDLIHGHGDVASRMCSLVHLFGSIPTLTTRHSDNFHFHWRLQNKVIAPSHKSAEEMIRRRLSKHQRLAVIPNFLPDDFANKTLSQEPSSLRRKLGIPKSAFALVSVGAISSRKNQSASVEVLGKLRSLDVDAHLVLIGDLDGPETEKIKSACQDLNLVDRVHLIGPLENASQVLRDIDVCISTSHSEQASIALLEAMAAGVPTVSTPAGSVSEVFDEAEPGQIINLADLDKTIGLLDKIAKDRSAWQALRDDGLERFRAKYTASAVIPQYERLYRELFRD